MSGGDLIREHPDSDGFSGCKDLQDGRCLPESCESLNLANSDAFLLTNSLLFSRLSAMDTTTPKQLTEYTDHNSLWKDVLDQYFPEFLEVFFPISLTNSVRKQLEGFVETDFAWDFGEKESKKWRVDKLVFASSKGEKMAWIVAQVIVLTPQENLCYERMYSYDKGTRKMKYVTGIERHGFKKGLAQSMQEYFDIGLEYGFLPKRLQRFHAIIVRILQTRFHPVSETPIEAVKSSNDLTALTELLRNVITVGSLEEFVMMPDRQAAAV